MVLKFYLLCFIQLKGTAKKNSNYAPSEVAFSRLSGIDCTQPFFEIRPGLISDLAQMRLYMDRNWNKLEKACSRSNFEERFGTIHSWEPGEFNLRGHINRKKFENFFYDSLLVLKIYSWLSQRSADLLIRWNDTMKVLGRKFSIKSHTKCSPWK